MTLPHAMVKNAGIQPENHPRLPTLSNATVSVDAFSDLIDVPEMDRRVEKLLASLSDNVVVLRSGEAGEHYLRDWTGAYGCAATVVRPRTPQALAAVVQRFAAAGIRMVVQGGMSGLVGGGAPCPGEVVVSTELLRAIEDCDILGGTMTVQAGVTLQAVQEEAQRHGLFYPVDMGSRGSCVIGGNLATNAGGNRVLQYGMTRASVLGLEVVLADGSVLSLLGQVIKDNAGYDLKQLFIGSEGTLGFITRVVLRLQPLPRERVTIALGLHSLPAVLEALVACRRHFGPGLTAFEVMWRDFFSYVTGELGIGRDPFDGQAAMVVLIEVSCFDASAERDLERITESLQAIAAQLATDHVVIAKSLAQASALWQVRDASGEVARSLGDYLSFDISIPTRRLQVVLDRIHAGLRALAPQLRCMTYGHLGDGNLHLLIAGHGALAQQVEQLVYTEVQACGGSISAEHGIGLAKRDALQQVMPAPALRLMRRIKSALDPHGLINHGRVLAPAASDKH
ncbi:MAG: FAD-binding oxidoreductase [Burkholderiaceae bacterium]